MTSTPRYYDDNKNTVLSSSFTNPIYNNKHHGNGRTEDEEMIVIDDNNRQYNGFINNPGLDSGESHREMAIDCPENFTGRKKQPPRFPSATGAGGAGKTVDQVERIRFHQEELRKRKEEETRIATEQEFLRTSLRGSKKLQALEHNKPSVPPEGVDNTGFIEEEVDSGRPPSGREGASGRVEKPVSLNSLFKSIQNLHVSTKHENDSKLTDDISKLYQIFQTDRFRNAIKIREKILEISEIRPLVIPVNHDSVNACVEAFNELPQQSRDPRIFELASILQRPEFQSVLVTHDKVAPPYEVSEPLEGEVYPSRGTENFQFLDNDVPIRIVTLFKSGDPLGATVRNHDDAIIIGRIVKGGVAEKSGLLHEGDEILEVNNVPLRGKTVTEVSDLLAEMNGTLTFLVVPGDESNEFNNQHNDQTVHVKAYFNYDPVDDLYIPCKELGISFQCGDILHVINQTDGSWWQAYRDGEDTNTLAGLIPSKTFQQHRDAAKQVIVDDDQSTIDNQRKKNKKLCFKKSTKKNKKKVLYNASTNEDHEAEEVLTYEEVDLYYPQPNRKRPLVLIGPPNVGRHDLRQRLMESDFDRFAAAIPHTSRLRRDGEVDGRDYHFIPRPVFESDINTGKFVEHGEFEKNLYGTSIAAIREVINSGKICVLNLHPQSLKILKASDLKPYVIFIAAPNIENLKSNCLKAGKRLTEEELRDIINRGREIEETFGHYFDLAIVNYDINKTYDDLIAEIYRLEIEPQWVPAQWVRAT
ncbi:protein PALS1-like [Tubulanus polymorphus]|uniref:protein PALS1-like n=1 Tax=Tubulanus polymorphus TaxID=672921 RepID=UPI003DA5BF30